jgi:hypothetical protein
VALELDVLKSLVAEAWFPDLLALVAQYVPVDLEIRRGSADLRVAEVERAVCSRSE